MKLLIKIIEENEEEGIQKSRNVWGMSHFISINLGKVRRKIVIRSEKFLTLLYKIVV